MKKPRSRATAITERTKENYRNEGTTEITRRMASVAHDIQMLDASIDEWTRRLSSAKAERTLLEAELAGLTAVLGKR